MNKRIILFCSFLWLSLVSLAQYNGQVIDANTKKTIPFASVYLIDYQIGTLSNEEGKFNFSHELPTEFNVRITAPNYESLIITLSSAEIGKTIELFEAHTELNEVTVSTPRSGLQYRNVTHVESRNIDELMKIPATNPGELLQRIPGVYNASTGNGVSKPVVRGLQGMRVVTLMNGNRIESQQWGSDHDLGYTTLGIGSVEVIKGPSSLMYGSDAIGGVIYFKDVEYASQHSYSIRANTGFESNTLGTNSQLVVKSSGKNVRWTGAVGYMQNADYGIGLDQFVVNSRFNNLAAKTSLGFNKKNWVSHLRYAYSHQNVGIIGAHHDHEEGEEGEHEEHEDESEEYYSPSQERGMEVPYQSYDNHLLSWESKWFKPKGQWQFLVSYGMNGLSEFEESQDTAAMKLNLHTINYTVRNQRHFNKLELFTGYQGAYQLNLNSGAEEQLIPDASYIDNGIYLITHVPIKQWIVQGGLRLDSRYLKSAMTEDSLEVDKLYFGYNFGLGAVRDGKNNTLRVNVSSGYRVPHVSELLSMGVHHGGQRFEVGDPNLSPERAYQFDLSDEIHGEHMEVIINPFVNLMQDFIYLRRMPFQADGYDVYTYSQLPNALFAGVDVAVHYHPHFAHWLHWMPTVSILYADDLAGNAIDRVPPGRLTNELKLTFASKEENTEFDVIVEHRYNFAQNRVGVLETPTPDFHIINAGLNVGFGKSLRWDVSMGIKNLLDAKYIEHLSGLKTLGISAPGRNFYCRLQVEF